MSKSSRPIIFTIFRSFAVFFIIAVFICIGIFLYLGLVPLKIENTNKYLKTDGFQSDFVAFPISINNLNVQEYHYYDYHLRDGVELILTVQYTDQEFNKELNRLDSIQYTRTIDGLTKSVAKDEQKQLFNYFTYVFTYDTEFILYEYVCVDFDKKQITYVFLDCLSLDFVTIDYNYLPKKYVDNNEFYDRYLFNIYSDKEDLWL
ncbi:MAG: hypothetical protein IJV77_06775 [Clostridia bacterium]|nr:hypothetical protein [Clostridia bacterium]